MLDTHVISFINQNELFKFSKEILDILENEDLYISPIVVLELKYLYDIKRINNSQDVVINTLKQEIGLQIDDISFLEVINSGMDLSWTRDPFDRLLVAHAKFRSANLITKDERILNNFDLAIW
jgi:PIN domain nuclease of toxin-antitoxin system